MLVSYSGGPDETMIRLPAPMRSTELVDYLTPGDETECDVEATVQPWFVYSAP